MFRAMLKGAFAYVFNEHQPARETTGTSSRATFLQYQSYPDNLVQGAGTLVDAPRGNMWKVQQPPQYDQPHLPVISSLVAGGTVHSVIENQSLMDTSKASG